MLHHTPVGSCRLLYSRRPKGSGTGEVGRKVRAQKRVAVLSVVGSLAAACLAPGAARAQEGDAPGFPFDRIEVHEGQDPESTCYLSPRHIVVERRRAQEVGSDFYIRSRERRRCDADSLSGDWVLRDEWAASFSAIRGDALILDSGTGPDIRYLILIDVAKRKRLAEVPYVEVIPGPDSVRIGVWDGSELEEPPAGCEWPTGGLLPGVDSLRYLDLRTGDRRFAGRVRCAQRQ